MAPQSIVIERNKETEPRRPWAYLWGKHDSIMKGAAWKQLLLWQGSKRCNCPSGEPKRLLLENNFSLLATSPPARGRRWFCVSRLRPSPPLPNTFHVWQEAVMAVASHHPSLTSDAMNITCSYISKLCAVHKTSSPCATHTSLQTFSPFRG